MRIALYGGTFDPIHHGHLILARDAREELALDRVLFIPAAISPHKLHCAPASGQDRCRMIEAAIADEPGFSVEPIEILREGPSYAVETVEALRAAWPDAELFYLIGHDNIAKLDTWHRIEDLRRMVEFVVFGRGGHDAPHPFRRLTRRIDISASEIRTRVARGASIRYLVPETVEAIIERHHLYHANAGA
jgi:nicotinate-nucleotide adenylyltransferase